MDLINEQLFYNLSTLYSDDFSRKKLKSQIEQEDFFIKLNTKIEAINSEILEKRSSYKGYYKNRGNNYHSNNNQSSTHQRSNTYSKNYTYNDTTVDNSNLDNSNLDNSNLKNTDTEYQQSDIQYSRTYNKSNKSYKQYAKPYNKQYKSYNKGYHNNYSNSYNTPRGTNYKGKYYGKSQSSFQDNLNGYIKDDVYLTLNRNLNKLSINNFDAIMSSNLECIGMYIVNEINEYIENYNKFFVKFRGDENMIQDFNFTKLFTKHKEHINFIIMVCLKKSLIQLDDYKLYFKYIQTLQNAKIGNFKDNVLKRVNGKLSEIININNETKSLSSEEIENINLKLNSKYNEFKNNIQSELDFSKLIEHCKNTIRNYTIGFLKHKCKLDDDNDNQISIDNQNLLSDSFTNNTSTSELNSIFLLQVLNEYFKTLSSHGNLDIKKFKSETTFNFLGYFNKYFGNFNSNSKSSFNEYLLSIYENFKNINELLIWEPINMVELENRIYFVIGFLEANNKFIKCLDYDFFQDIESELETIKKAKNIPVSVKYKLFDTIDNFIQSRYTK
jgi:hypothetical protein